MAPRGVVVVELRVVMGGALAYAAFCAVRERYRRTPYASRGTTLVGRLLRRLGVSLGQTVALDKAQILADRRRHTCANQSISYVNTDPLVIVSGSGATLVDEQGRRYLDTRNNVAHVGHAHAVVAEAVAQQVRCVNTNTRYLHPNLVALAQGLLETMPKGSPLRDGVVFFVNSGSEANDLAARLAQKAWRGEGAAGMLVVDRAYHGHTAAARVSMVATIGLSPYKYEHASFGGRGKPENVEAVPAPDVYRGVYRGLDAAIRYASTVDAAVSALAARGFGPAAFFVESGMSVAGVLVAPRGYMKAAYAKVRALGGICVADEVQTALGRTGAFWYAFEAHGVCPDIVTMGKPMGNGMPLAAVICSARIARAFEAGPEYFNTFGGNPVCCAAGLAVLDVIRNEGLRDNAKAVGDWLRAQLEALVPPAMPARRGRDADAPQCFVGDVRGAGLFIGIDLVSNVETRAPATLEASFVCSRLVSKHRILTSVDGPFDNVIVVKPPLCFSKADARRFVSALAAELDHVNTLPSRNDLGGHTPT